MLTEQQLIYIRRRRSECISWYTLAKELDMPWKEIRKEFMQWVKKNKIDGIKCQK